MKKNFAMRVAACLLVVTMLSLCMVSYTYAKYTTGDTLSDSATVALWGINLTIDGDDLLYDDAKTGNEVDGKKVTLNTLAAPGTYQKLATVALTGKPDVSYKITVVVDLKLTGWNSGETDDPATTEKDESVYCPLVFTVDGTSYKIDSTYKTTADLETAIETAIKNAISGDDSGVKVYDAGEQVATKAADGTLIDWTWAFESGNDKLDTVLGNAAAATIGFELTVTVEQVD
jgi:hypothetical protein